MTNDEIRMSNEIGNTVQRIIRIGAEESTC